MTKYKFEEVRKTAVAVVGFVLTALWLASDQSLLPAEVDRYVPLLIALGTIYGVFRVPNAQVRGRHAE